MYLYRLIGIFWLGSMLAASAATFVVSTTADAGPGSLRQAITDANVDTTPDLVQFNIPGAGPHRINLLTELPDLINPVKIDGYSQPGAQPATAANPAVLKIELGGNDFFTSSSHQYLIEAKCQAGEAVEIRGLSLVDSEFAIVLRSGGGPHVVTGNWFGIRPNGDLGFNKIHTIYNETPNTQVGGTSDADRNLFAGQEHHSIYNLPSAVGAMIENNWFGVAPDGVSATIYGARNSSSCGIYNNAPNATIRNNVISGSRYGLRSFGGGATIQGNLFGLDPTGMFMISNEVWDAEAGNVGDNIIGGPNPGEANRFGKYNNGFYLHGVNNSNNLVQANTFGLDATGNAGVNTNYYNVGGWSLYIRAPHNQILNNTIGNTRYGMLVHTSWAHHNIVRGNAVGVNEARDDFLPSRIYGVQISGGAYENTFGGPDPSHANIFGHIEHHGMLMENTHRNWIEGNYLGQLPDGTPGDLFYDGCYSYNNCTSNTFIRNTITNPRYGIVFRGTNAIGNVVSETTITSNANRAIELHEWDGNSDSLNAKNTNDPLDADKFAANWSQNHPELTWTALDASGKLDIRGVFHGAANTAVRVELFANQSANRNQMNRYLGHENVTTDAQGNASFERLALSGITVGEWIVATATTIDGTSELSEPLEVTEQADLRITSTQSPNPAAEFAPVTITLTIENLGPGTARNLSADVPMWGLRYQSHTATKGQYGQISSQWVIDQLANGETAVLTITAQVDAGFGGRTLGNNVVIKGSYSETNPNNEQTLIPATIQCPQGIRGAAFIDRNGNGQFDAEDGAASGVRVEARDNAGNVLAESASGPTGMYFLNLPNGTAATVFIDTGNGHWDLVGAASIAATSPACQVDASVLPSRRFTPYRHPPGPCSRFTPLAITEIHYHPPTRADGRNLEFIELFNSDPVSMDISGYRIEGDVDYTFPPLTVLPPFGYVVIAADPADLYPETSPGTLIHGPYDGELDNGGGTVRLVDDFDRYLLDIPFDDRLPWPRMADGHGHSIVLTRPSHGEQHHRAWGFSAKTNGSPGRHDDLLEDDLVINEILAGASGFIEVFNRGAQSHSLGGMRITTNAAETGFTIPANVQLMPGQRVSFSTAQLGFDVSDVKVVMLNDPAANRIRDLQTVGGRRPGVAFGRSPDGSERLHDLASPTASQPNANPQNGPVVISEIMYSPASNEDADEYLELHNRTSGAINLEGWSFTDGIDFTFPAGATLPPNGFVVLAKDAGRLIANYAQLNAGNTFGDYKGTLSNGGETLILRNALDQFVDEVRYEDGGRWGQWSDGGGSSLELIDPDADNSDPSNWRDSDETQKSQWQTFSRSGVIEHDTMPNEKIMVMNLKGGEFLLDDVQVSSGGQSLLDPVNGGFEAASNSWFLAGNHDPSEIISTDAAGGSHSLHVRTSAGGNTLANFVRHNLTTNILTNAVNVELSVKARWLRGSHLMLVRTWGRGFELVCEFDIPTNLGSPGLANPSGIANAGPSIRAVRHEPVLPAANEPVTLFAQVADPDGIANVALRYRIFDSTNAVAFQSIAMRDDGIAPDLRANDGHYAVTLPAQDTNTVGFSIEATDSLGVVHAFPDAPSNNEGIINWGEAQPTGTMQDMRLWISPLEADLWSNRYYATNNRYPATIVLNGHRVIYHAMTRARGSQYGRRAHIYAGGPLGPNGQLGSFALIPPRDQRIWNATRVNINVIGQGPGWDRSSLTEKLSYELLKELGLPTAHHRFIRFGVNGNNRANLDGVFFDVANPGDTDYLWSNYAGNDQGHMHKAAVNTEVHDDWRWAPGNMSASLDPFPSVNEPRFAKHHHRLTWWKKETTGLLDDDFEPFFDLIAGVNDLAADNDTLIASMDQVMDVQQWFRMTAFQQWMADYDSVATGGSHNNHIYLAPGGKWQLHNRDFDHGWIRVEPTRDPFYVHTHRPRPQLDRFFSHPAIRRIMLDGFRLAVESVDAPAHPARMLPRMEKWHAVIEGEQFEYHEIEAMSDWIVARRTFLLSQIPQASLAIDQVNYNTGDDTAVLTGTAPIGANTLLFNGNAYPVTWTTDTVWRVEIPLVAGANPIQLTAIDYDGNMFGGNGDNVTVNKTTPAPSAVGSVVINEVHYHGTTGDDFVELHNTSTTDRFDLSGWRLDGVDLDIAGGTLIEPGAFLTFVADREDFGALYPLIPIAAEYDGSLDNGGETLQLLDASSNVVDLARYDDVWPWPASPDGLGDSLQLIDAAQNRLHPGNWAAVPPTPNAANSVAASLPPLAPVWINEVAATAPGGSWVELYTDGSLSIDGYQLRSLIGNIQSLSGTLANWGTFAFSLPGAIPTGTVTLVDANGIVLDAIHYSHLDPSHSVGLVPDGDPLSQLRMHQQTPGAANNPASLVTPVLFNEWMAKNPATSGITDPADGDADDWLELHNPGATTTDLSDYVLSDGSSRSRLAPGTTIAPGGHLLLWADDEDGQGPDHLDFKLSGGGETLTLIAPDGSIAQTLTFGPQQDGVPEGRWKDAEPAPFWPLHPTPGAPNQLTAVNSPPALMPSGATTIDEGTAATINLFVLNAEAPPQTSVISQTAGPGTLNPATGVWTWTPTEADGPGTFNLSFSVVDNGTPPASNTLDMAIVVREVNQPPAVTVTGPTTIAEYQTLLLQVTATDADVPVQSLSYSLSNGSAGMSLNTATGVFRWTPTEGQGGSTHTATITVSDGISLTHRPVTITVTEANSSPVVHHGPLGNCPTNRFIISQGATWRYRDNGAAPPANWNQFGFDDSAWSTGAGKFGFGEGDENTLLSAGHTTYWFRHTFQAGDQSGVTGLLLEMLRDDGAAVYLNGLEIRRDNLPAGLLTASTRATTSAFGNQERAFHASSHPASALLAGENLLAVELHQVVNTSNDLGFDLRLQLSENLACATPLPPQTSAANTPWSLDLDVQDTDVPVQAITWSLAGAPAGMTIDNTGLIQWPGGSAGLYTFSALATDAAGATSAYPVELHVTDVPVISLNAWRHQGVIQWPTVPGQTYVVECCDDLKIGTWVVLQSVTANASTSQFSDPTAGPAIKRFYRIKWLP